MAKKRQHHLFKRDNIWYFRKKINGQEVRLSLETSIVTEAIRLRDQLLEHIRIHGNLPSEQHDEPDNPKFGEIAMKWAKIKQKEIKLSTFRDYKSAMNGYILPTFGNKPIKDITYMDVEEFKAGMNCSAKRVNNILVPMRSVFDMAYKNGIIESNVMAKVDNLTIKAPVIHPLSIEEVHRFLETVDPVYKPFFTTAFFTGMRFGEMAGLKWKNVKLNRKILTINQTLVYGVEDRPKTTSSNRDVDLLPPVIEALEEQKNVTVGTDTVFLDRNGNPMTPDYVRAVIWKPTLKRAEIDYRPMLQTRHTFATMMLDSGEDIGWVQKMMGHQSLQMIFSRYYSWIRKETRNDGSAFLKNMYANVAEEPQTKTSQLRHTQQKKVTPETM